VLKGKICLFSAVFAQTHDHSVHNTKENFHHNVQQEAIPVPNASRPKFQLVTV
jgi:hypothetical protein